MTYVHQWGQTRRAKEIRAGIGVTPEKRKQYLANWERMEKQPAAPPSPRPTRDVLAEAGIDKEQLAQAAEAKGMLLGDAIAELTTRIGIPPCGRCERWQQWFNAAHRTAREWFGLEQGT